MNTQQHRVIFNRQRNCMMAVSEVASSTGKTKSRKSRSKRCNLHDSPVAGKIELNSSLLYPLKTALAQSIRVQAATDYIAFKLDVNITAKKVDIIEARETSASQSESKFKQRGLTISISSPVLSAIQGAQGMAQAAGNTSNGRMQALAGASIALQGYNTYNSLTDTAGNFSPAAAADVKITATLGTSKSQSNSSSQSDTARGSSITGNNVNITATGDQQDSNILIQGSSIKAANTATLTADNAIALQAAKNESSQTSTNSSSSSSVNVSYSATTGWGGGASAAKGSGKSDGQDTSYTNTQIAAGNTASITSGALRPLRQGSGQAAQDGSGDLNIKGAVVAANQIKADVGGSLNIESLQDTSTSSSKQQSAGGSITFSPAGVPTGASISASRSNINSNFQSVNEQSA